MNDSSMAVGRNADFADVGIVKKKSTTELIVDKITSLIREKKLTEGDKLPTERELAAMLQVSRPSLREAMKSLQMMNMIEIKQGSGMYLKKVTPDSVIEHLDIVFSLDKTLYNDLYAARRVLEPAIAGVAATSITTQQLQQLEKNALKARQSIDDIEEFYKLDIELHEIIRVAADNRILSLFLETIGTLSRLVREKTNSSFEARGNTISDHERIINALKERNPEKASKAMESHLLKVEQVFKEMALQEGTQSNG